MWKCYVCIHQNLFMAIGTGTQCLREPHKMEVPFWNVVLLDSVLRAQWLCHKLRYKLVCLFLCIVYQSWITQHHLIQTCCEAEAYNRSEAGCRQKCGKMAVNTIMLQVMYYAKGIQYQQIIFQLNSFVVSDKASCTFVPLHQNSLHSIICPMHYSHVTHTEVAWLCNHVPPSSCFVCLLSIHCKKGFVIIDNCISHNCWHCFMGWYYILE